MSGDADYSPAPGYEDARHFIGDPKSPVWIGRKSEVPALAKNPYFAHAFYCWRMHRAGFGLPNEGAWTDQEPWLIEALLLFEEQFQAHFSHEHYNLEAQSAIIRLLSGRRR
jgi:hypothetical protein